MSYRSDYGYAGASIRVVSPERPVLDWLDEFLSPSFEVGPRESCDVRIEVRFGATEYGEILQRGSSGDPESLDWFSLDGDFESHPRWVSHDGDCLSHDQRREVFYSHQPAQHRATLVARADNGAVRIGLMRLVREIATAHCLRSRRIHIHGSAFSLNGRGVVITGPKMAGKTSLLMNALRTGMADFVTNDRLFIDPGGVEGHDTDRAWVIGMPTIVSVRAGSFDFFPELKSGFSDSAFDRNLTRNECLNGSLTKITHKNRWPPSLSPIQFCDLLGVKPATGTTLSAFVLPSISSDVETFALERLDENSATAAIYAGVFRSAKPQAIPAVFRSEGDELLTEADLQRASRALAREIDCYRCLLGPKAYSEPRLAEEFIRQVTSG